MYECILEAAVERGWMQLEAGLQGGQCSGLVLSESRSVWLEMMNQSELATGDSKAESVMSHCGQYRDSRMALF